MVTASADRYPGVCGITLSARRQLVYPRGHAQRGGTPRGAQGRLPARRPAARAARSSPSTRQTVVFGSGNADADLMFVGEAPGRQRGQAGPAVRRPGGEAAGHAARRDRPHARGRLRRERPQVPASGQPRPAAAGDRQLPGLPVPPARADRAEGRLHARQLLHEAAARRPDDGHHAPARPRGGPRRSARARCGCTRSTTRPRRSTRRSLLDTLRADFARLPELLALDPPPQPEPEPEPVVAEPELVEEIEEEPSPSQLGLF